MPEYAKDLLERPLDDVIKNTSGNKVSQADLNRVAVAAQIQDGIDRYRAQGETMSRDRLEAEHHNSTRLSRHLEETGKSVRQSATSTPLLRASKNTPLSCES